MPGFSSITAKLRIPALLQVAMLLVVVYFYFSTQSAIELGRDRSRELGAGIMRMQELTADARAYMNGYLDHAAFAARIEADRSVLHSLPPAAVAALEPVLTHIGDGTREAEALFRRNLEIEEEVFNLTGLSTEQSDNFIKIMVGRLVDPETREAVSQLERAVIGGASINSGTNHNIRVLFLQLKSDIAKREQMLGFLDTAISNAANDEQRLADTPFQGMPRAAREANQRIRTLVEEYLGNLEKVAVLGARIDAAVGTARTTLDELAETSNDAAFGLFHDRLAILMAIVLVSALILAVLSVTLSRAILSPINRLNDTMRQLAQSGGDLTFRLDAKGNGEIDQLAQSFNAFLAALQDIFGQVSSRVTELSGLSTRSQALSHEAAEHMRNQSERVGDIAGSVHELQGAAETISGATHQAAQTAGQVDDEVRQGMEIVDRSRAAADQLEDRFGVVADIIVQLQADGRNIDTILGVIRDIADQTNLLALNAAIEAARAGEQGRGFAVVADEVRALAGKSQESAQEIQLVLETIKTATERAVSAIDQGRSHVDSSVALSRQTQEALSAISSAVARISDMNTSIAQSAEEQSTVTGNVSGGMDEVARLAQEARDGALQAASIGDELAALASSLEKITQQFKV